MKKKTKKAKRSTAIISKRDYSLPERVEQALAEGNLINLTPEERVKLILATCRSLRLNHLTKPFIYILMKDYDDEKKLILYASRNCTDQLRTVRGVTVVPGSLKQWKEGDYLKAQVAVMDRTGRTDEDLGVINLKQYRGNPVNAEMHVVTKAKRRATLSLCGLGGIVDESELDTMNVIGGVTASGRIFEYPKPKLPMPRLTKEEIVDAKNTGNWCEKHSCDMRKCPSDEHSQKELDEWFERVQRAKKFADRLQAAPQSVPTGGQTLPGPQSPVQHAAGTEGGAPPQSTTPNAPPSAPKPEKKAPKATVAATGAPGGKGNGNQAIPLATPSPTNAPTESLNFKPPQARIPVVVKSVRWTKSGKYPCVELDTGKWLVCFDNKKMGEDHEQAFDILMSATGKICIFLTKNSKKKGSDEEYTQITHILRCGDREWEEDGMPVLRREPATKGGREPGEDSPEEWLK